MRSETFLWSSKPPHSYIKAANKRQYQCLIYVLCLCFACLPVNCLLFGINYINSSPFNIHSSFSFQIFLLPPSCTLLLFSYPPLSLSLSPWLPFLSLHLLPVIFKEVNTCNPATITGTLSRISLDDEDDPKLAAHQEGGVGVNFSSLPGNIPPPNLIVQVWG